MKPVLFVGGAMDGQRMMISGEPNTVEFPRFAKAAGLVVPILSDGGLSLGIEVDQYRRVYLVGRDPAIYLHTSLLYVDLAEQLVANYGAATVERQRAEMAHMVKATAVRVGLIGSVQDVRDGDIPMLLESIAVMVRTLDSQLRSIRAGHTRTVEFNLAAALVEGAVRDKLVEMGWTPPAADQAAHIVGDAARLVAAEVDRGPGHACLNTIINSGAEARPKSCPACGLAKECPRGVVRKEGA